MKDLNERMQVHADGTIEISDATKLPKGPAVSVVMLAYQHEKFIEQAIKGVIAQECNFSIELIIGEDCSADRTRQIVLDYQHRYPHIIRVLTADKNVGMHANSDRCSKACRGEFIASCEGDDYWQHPRKLQMQLDLMKKNEGMHLCHTDFDRVTKFRLRRSRHRANPTPWLAQGNAYEALLMEWSIMTCTTMFRRSLLESFDKSEYNNPRWPFGDRNRHLFASLAGPIGYIDESTATFRKRMGSASNSGAIANLNMALGNLECIELFIAKNPVDDEIRRGALARMYRWVYDAGFRVGKIDVLENAYAHLSEVHMAPTLTQHRIRKLLVALKFPIWVSESIKSIKNRYLSAA